MSDAASIEQLARQIAKRKRSPTDWAKVVSPLRARQIPPEIWARIDELRDHSPREALALAYCVNALADQKRERSQRARANLYLIRALNTQGEFRQAINRCSNTANQFEQLADPESAAYVWLEAAWAETYLGHLDRAEEYLKCARVLSSPLFREQKTGIKSDWIRARILREQGKFNDALHLFEQVHNSLVEQGEILDALRALREQAYTCSYIDPKNALPLLVEVKHKFETANCKFEVAKCESHIGQTFNSLNQHQDAVKQFTHARLSFAEDGLNFFAIACDLDLGYTQWRLQQLDSALSLLSESRKYFLRCNADSQASSCEINLGGILGELNRYDDAITYWQDAAKLAQATSRQTKAALCWMNIGWALDRKQEYARALEYYLRAREIFASERMVIRLTHCDLNLGLTRFNLGEYDTALEVLDHAKQNSLEHNLFSYLAECRVNRAQVLLARRQLREACQELDAARTQFATQSQTMYVAYCDRLLAGFERRNRKGALARLANSRRVFIDNGQVIDAALCDLTRGELHLAWREWKKAVQFFNRAGNVLDPGFPDDTWRFKYGLGRAALGQHKKRAAMTHFLSAAQTLANVRGALGVEYLSNSVFAARQPVVHEALALAWRERWDTDGLQVIESAKEQTLRRFLTRNDWNVSRSNRNPQTQKLLERERSLRYQLSAFRASSSLYHAQVGGDAFRGGAVNLPTNDKYAAEIMRLSDEYEGTITALKLHEQGLAGVPRLDPFSLEIFREQAQARWGKRWAALDYYFAEGKLYIACVEPDQVKLSARRWSNFDQRMLEKCASSHRDLRELVYRGTLQGQYSASVGRPLEYLTERLIPKRLLQPCDQFTLLIAPHSLLHQLPFHALKIKDTFLIERMTLLYTPSLQSNTQLWKKPDQRKSKNMLACGASEFQDAVPALPYTEQEIEGIRTLNAQTQVLWQEALARERLIEWNESGALKKFNMLHFATHTIIEPLTPHLSRILLGRDALSVFDITDLELEAQLVTLSACSTALGKSGSGDEMVGLTRAFFYAGARALVASLWTVEDESTAELMKEFYRNLAKGNSIAQALRGAQLQLKQNGATPFQWAPFLAMGEV